MMGPMARFFLIAALLLMTTSLAAPLWVRSPRHSPAGQSRVVSGRLTGDFSDAPWLGSIVTFGNERVVLAADGSFGFRKFPGTYALSVCCSPRYRRIYREITVRDKDQYLEIPAEPLLEVSGRLVDPPKFERAVRISARMIGTSTADWTVVASDGTFVFHLMEGDWQVDFANLPPGFAVRSMTLDGKELRERTFTISSARGPSLPLRIKLQK